MERGLHREPELRRCLKTQTELEYCPRANTDIALGSILHCFITMAASQPCSTPRDTPRGLFSGCLRVCSLQTASSSSRRSNLMPLHQKTMGTCARASSSETERKKGVGWGAGVDRLKIEKESVKTMGETRQKGQRRRT